MNACKPLLSICIPTYNRADIVCVTLKDFISDINSLNDEDKADVEIVVRDNASVDNTFELLQQCAAGLEFVHIYRSETNIGGDMNIATLPELASGEYVWVCGDDDEYKPGALNAILRKIRETCPAMIFLNHRQLLEKGGKVYVESCVDYTKPTYYEDGRNAIVDISKVASIGPILFMSAKVYKRAYYIEATKEIGAIFNSFSLSVALRTAVMGSVAVIQECHIDNIAGDYGWVDIRENIHFEQLPSAIDEMPNIGYTYEQYQIVRNSYLTKEMKRARRNYFFRKRFPQTFKLLKGIKDLITK